MVFSSFLEKQICIYRIIIPTGGKTSAARSSIIPMLQRFWQQMRF
jgi:hypothetical protein